MEKILLIIDYQVDFVDGSLGFEDAKLLDYKIAERIKQAHQDNCYIMYTQDTHLKNYLNTQEGKRLPIIHTIVNTPGWELYGKTKVAIEEVKKYDKNRVDRILKYSFGSNDLFQILKYPQFKDIKEIEICGVVTNMCVISNAIICKTTLPEARIIINAELCAAPDKDLHEQALNVMASMQMDIINRGSKNIYL
jgi:nicotinamidase-related amidase